MSSSIDTASLIAGAGAIQTGYAKKQEPDPDQMICSPWTRRDIGDMYYIKGGLDWLLDEIKSGFTLTEERHGWTIRNIVSLDRALQEKERVYAAKFNPYHKPAGSPDGGQFDNAPGGSGGGGGSSGGGGGTPPSHSPSTSSPKIPSPTRKPHVPGQPHQPQNYSRSTNPSPATHVTVRSQTDITIHHEDGSTENRIGGSRAWRNNNPGNVIDDKGGFARRHGAIGSNNGMAVFPDAQTGYQADTTLLKGPTYSPMTINKVIAKRSPPNENDTLMLQREITKRAGLSGDQVMKDLTRDEFSRLQEAIYHFEGWKEGTVTKTPSKSRTF